MEAFKEKAEEWTNTEGNNDILITLEKISEKQLIFSVSKRDQKTCDEDKRKFAITCPLENADQWVGSEG